jgi:hypothetical protein
MSDERRTDLKQYFRKLIEGENLSRIAREAGISYWALQRWAKGETNTLDLDTANRLHLHLTGKELNAEGITYE